MDELASAENMLGRGREQEVWLVWQIRIGPHYFPKSDSSKDECNSRLLFAEMHTLLE